MIRPLFLTLLCLGLAACAKPGADVSRAAPVPSNLYPGETPQMRTLVRQYAAKHDIPEALLHRVIQRESDYRPHARNGPYWGLMQVLPQTAQQMGFQGAPERLLDAEVNLTYAGRYLRGAWLVSNGDIDRAVMWYARGYYYEARDRCMLVATGLRDREVRRDCPSRAQES
ncbi:lytic transglycosylase domain-containing protein [Roseinatronobacter monicus]|jgi:soluble lytic murein transglycosylase-like protein|uniref:Transglycosylase-like protein with SLT domain n=1 Tax=Roseinatronobacter monicus TaxID=393481 RepID=A0A543KDC5_9RHOB|nr:lytic transglycosylase domain-containing protein [Roseinatronobacter monicus]TQM93082.1 transglycosylase-like protein with SLT domain [Roseinatronobacter monicus]